MSKYSETVDSRDLLAELRELMSDSSYDYNDAPQDTDAWTALDDEDRERVEMLRSLLDELPESTVDSPHGNSWGCTLVREDYFVTFAQEFAEEIGAIEENASWPGTYIDWNRAAAALKQDYTAVELDGTTYYAR